MNLAKAIIAQVATEINAPFNAVVDKMLQPTDPDVPAPPTPAPSTEPEPEPEPGERSAAEVREIVDRIKIKAGWPGGGETDKPASVPEPAGLKKADKTQTPAEHKTRVEVARARAAAAEPTELPHTHVNALGQIETTSRDEAEWLRPRVEAEVILHPEEAAA